MSPRPLTTLLVAPLAALALGLGGATVPAAAADPPTAPSTVDEERERDGREPALAPAADPEAAPEERVESPTGLWIVQLEEPPVALYDGGVKGLRATSARATGQDRLDVRAPASRAYGKHLAQEQKDVRTAMGELLGRDVKTKDSFAYALNGLTVALSADEAAAVAGLPGIEHVWPDQEWELDTDVSMDLIAAPDVWTGTTGSGVSTRGEGVIVGMLDSGVNPDHPSFAATDGEGYTHTNPFGAGVYKGVCAPDAPRHEDICNDKLIGAYSFVGGSAVDDNGHGSHTGSTMAGNVHDAVFTQGATTYTRTVSGVAPRANVISYRVCSILCPSTASVAAVEQAIADGTDVLNFSISGPDDPWDNAVDQAFLAAYEAGIFVSASAGNDGPGPGTVAKTAPWNAAVGATNSPRLIAHAVEVTDDGAPAEVKDLAGVPGTGPAITTPLAAPIRYAGSVQPGNERACTALPAGSLTGAIALIERGDCNFSVKVDNADAAGAVAAVVWNQFGGPPIVMGGLESTDIPAVMLSNNQGTALRDYLLAHPDAQAAIGPDTVETFDDSWTPMVTDFSSRGPSSFDLLAPTFTAPGRGILAATKADGGDSSTYEFMQGTSMASPHGAGAGALLRALHPDWSPAMIRSALASSADPEGMLKDDGVTPADPFDVGSGALDVGAASRVGLVMDESHADFVAADPEAGGDPRTLNLPAVVDDSCLDVCTFERTVTDVTGAETAYTVSTRAPEGVTVTVSPEAFTVPAGGSRTLTVTVDVSQAAGSRWHFGDVLLSTDATHPGGADVTDVHYPVAAYAAAAEITVDPTELTSSQDVAEVTTHEVLVTNEGGAPATWQVDRSAEGCALPDWVTVDPTGGDIAPGGEQTLTVTFDSTGLVDGGTFEAALCLATNDPDQPVFEVALAMEVVPQPVAEVSPGELSATLEPYDVQERTMTVANTGWGVLDWTFEDPDAGPSDERIDLLREGVLLVPNSSSGQRAVMAFDPEDGSLIDADFIPYPAFLPGESLYTPLHALPTLEGDGFLVSDQVQGVISEYDLAGNFVGVFSPTSGVEDRAQMANIRGMAWSPEDTLLVTVATADNADSVIELAADGSYLGHRVAPQTDDLDGPWFVHVREDDMLVSASSRAIHSFSHDGQTVNERFVDPIYWPEQIAETPEGTVLVANLSSHSATGSVAGVYEFDADGDQLGHYTIPRNSSFGGVHPLGDGNMLVSTSTGVWELGRDGTAEQEFSGGRGRFITKVQLPDAMPCSTPEEIPWLDLAPGSGATSYGQSTEVTVRLDSTGLEPGDYEALLCMTSNDAQTPLVRVPVSMTVALPGCDRTVTGTFSGRLAVTSGTTCLAEGSTVDGPVAVSGDGRLYGDGATVNGPVMSSGGGGVMLVGSTVDGALKVSGATTAVVLDGNSVAGATSVDRNRTGLRPVVVSGNTVEGRLGCSGNEPPPTDLGQPNTATGKQGQCADL